MVKILEKIKNTISNETLGEVKVKEPPAKKPTSVDLSKLTSKNTPHKDIISTTGDDLIPTKERKSPGKYPVLKMLNLDLEPNTKDLITADYVDNIEFSITAPTGLNANEIEVFCDRVENDLRKYQEVISNRQQAFISLLDHIEELTQKLIEQKNESELANFIIENKSNEDKLKEQLVELRLENSELKRQLSELTQKLASKVTNELPKVEDLRKPAFPSFDDLEDVFEEE